MSRRVGFGAFLAAGLVVSALLAVLVAPRASGDPDGLERVAIDEGFEGAARDHPLEGSPTADYGVEGIDSDALGTAVAGVVGIALTFGTMWVLLVVLRRARGSDGPPPTGSPPTGSAA